MEQFVTLRKIPTSFYFAPSLSQFSDQDNNTNMHNSSSLNLKGKANMTT